MEKDITKVFISNRDSVCDECGEDLGRGAWITLMRDKGAVCLVCSDLDHLTFLPSGDAALTRRSQKHSRLSAVVLKWSRARKRYERQGLLVEEKALKIAEEECLADDEVRKRQRERQRVRAGEIDGQYVANFAERIRKLFPKSPINCEKKIAEHACLKYSGRVGRSARAKSLDKNAVRIAVVAYIRHECTLYDALLANGYTRRDARNKIENEVQRVLAEWEE